MNTRTFGLSRPSRFLVWLATSASLAMLLAAVFLSAPAKANHFIRPAWFPWEVWPAANIAAGIPAPDAFVSTRATRCTGGPQGGTSLLLRYLEYHWSRGEGTYPWGIYNCRLPSLHSEGRAVDYHLENYDWLDKQAGDHIFNFFLRADKSGHPAAMARRWGVQEIIWNCVAWYASDNRYRTYHRCIPGNPYYTTDRTKRHENHIHIGQNPYGAGGHTTAYKGYWSGH